MNPQVVRSSRTTSTNYNGVQFDSVRRITVKVVFAQEAGGGLRNRTAVLVVINALLVLKAEYTSVVWMRCWFDSDTGLNR